MKKVSFANSKGFNNKLANNGKIIYTGPFYGRRGSICKIIETEKTFITTRYGLNGQEEAAITTITPNKNKNKNRIFKECHQDLKNYLEINYDNYLSYTKKRAKKDIDIKKIAIATLLSIAILPISVFITMTMTGAISYIGVVGIALSLTTLCAEIDFAKAYFKDKKYSKKINEYKSYEKKLNNLNISLAQTKDNKKNTTYSNISNQSKDKIIDLEKTRKLIKNAS